MPPRRRQPAASDPPPALPGGYKVGEKVFFTRRSSQTATTGHKVVHGQQGEVTGPVATGRVKGKGVAVRFPGNKGYVNCYLNTVRHLRAAPAAISRLRPTHAKLCPRPEHPLCDSNYYYD